MGTGGVSAVKRPKSKPSGVQWVYEEEAKGGHEYVRISSQLDSRDSDLFRRAYRTIFED